MSLNKYDKKNIPRYIKTASMIYKNGLLLDIGARTAVLRKYINSNINYQVIDIDREAILKLRKQGVKADIMNAEDLQFNKKTFDIIVMGEVLEHIPNMGLVLEEVHRVLKDDGVFVISVPNGELKARLYLLLKRFYKIPFVKKMEKREPRSLWNIKVEE